MPPHALAAGFRALVTGSPTSPAPDSLTRNCGQQPGIVCRLAWDISHSDTLASLAKVYLAGPITVALRILFVLILAFVLRALVHRLIIRITARAATGTDSDAEPGHALLSGRSSQRRAQRSHALRSILGNVASIVIFGIAAITILGDLGVNLAPILASAGVLGVALGFGAQNLVGDFLAGVAILLEDQYGVGDVISVGTTSGTVEAVGLRVTRMRDVNGVVWHIRNGSLQQVGNQSQGWARAVIDFPVPYNQDMSEIREIMTGVATDMWNEPRWQNVILEEPKVWGVQSLSSSEAVWRVVAMTTPPRQYEVERELRERIKVELDARGIATAPTVLTLTGPDQTDPDQTGTAQTGPAQTDTAHTGTAQTGTAQPGTPQDTNQ